MKNIYFTLFLGLAILGSAEAQKKSTPDELLQEIASINNLMGMSAVAVHDNKIIYSGSFGQSNYAQNIPVSHRTLYRIASISKTVTAMAFMQLYEQGLVGLDDNISDIMGYTIENPAHPGIAITPRMLLAHTATLNDGNTYGSFLAATVNNPSPPSLHELVVPGGSYFSSNIWLSAQPGEYFQYSNLGYGVLAGIVEKIAQTRFDVYVREHILQPLGIEGSFNIQDIDNYSNIAVLYRMNCGLWEPQADNYPNGLPAPIDYSDYEPGHNGFIFGPQGGLRITAEDLAKIMLVLMSKGTLDEVQILSSETVLLMEQMQWQYDGSNGNNYYNLFNSWGLGLHLITNQENGDIVMEGYPMKGHAGEAYGLISDMYYNNDPDFGLIFITNGSAGPYANGWHSAFYEVEEQVFDVLYNAVIVPAMTDAYPVDITTEGMGTTIPTPGVYNINAGSTFDIEALPMEGWQFDHFIINEEMISEPAFQLTIEENTQIKAVFSEITTSTGSSKDTGLNIYMGPGNLLNLSFEAWPSGKAHIQVFNMQGIRVYSRSLPGPLPWSNHTIEIPGLGNNTYIAVVRGKNQPPVVQKLTSFF